MSDPPTNTMRHGFGLTVPSQRQRNAEQEKERVAENVLHGISAQFICFRFRIFLQNEHGFALRSRKEGVSFFQEQNFSLTWIAPHYAGCRKGIENDHIFLHIEEKDGSI